MFPEIRPRRLRQSQAMRRLVRETRFDASQLIAPLFIVEERGVSREIASLPHARQLGPDRAVEEIARLVDLGVGGVILFGIPDHKDAQGSSAWAEGGPVPAVLRSARARFPGVPLMADVCLCEYTDHGHCGVLIEERGEVTVENDTTLDLLARAAVCYAEAGADVIAPSDMMDGRIGHIREALDQAGHSGAALLSYAAKSSSAFYGPFRDAAGSAPFKGDRRTYQMDPANRIEALREIELDVAEGADMVMVKPALTALDVVADAAASVDVPVSAYLVSGESAMIDFAIQKGLLSERARVEALTGVFRAGARFVLTYWAGLIAESLGGRSSSSLG